MSESKAWITIQRLGTLVAIVTAIVSTAGLYFQLSKGKPYAEIQVLSADRLTQTSRISGLKSSFEFDNRKVSNLWLCRMSFVNQGDISILTKGPTQNTIVENLEIEFDPKYKVYNQVEKIDSEFESDLEMGDSSSMVLRFSQWRAGEQATFSFFVSSEDTAQFSMPTIRERYLIDGDVELVNLINVKQGEKKPLIDKWLSPTAAFVSRIIGSAFVSLVLVAIIVLLFKLIIEWFRLIIWKSRYSSELKIFLQSELFNSFVSQ